MGQKLSSDRDFFIFDDGISTTFWTEGALEDGGNLAIAAQDFELTQEQIDYYNSIIPYGPDENNLNFALFSLQVRNTDDVDSMVVVDQSSIQNLWAGDPLEIDTVCNFIPGNGTYNYPVDENTWNVSSQFTFIPCEYPGQEQGTTDCVDDVETVVFRVEDKDGNPISGYEIILDGGNAGFTNHNGRFVAIIKNASQNTKHTVNVCYCFETVGNCSQRIIKIVVTDDDVQNNSVGKADCTPI